MNNPTLEERIATLKGTWSRVIDLFGLGIASIPDVVYQFKSVMFLILDNNPLQNFFGWVRRIQRIGGIEFKGLSVEQTAPP